MELQRDLGPVRQATVVWQGRPECHTADTAYFSGDEEVTVTVTRWGGGVCVCRTEFDRLTLGPDQPHSDWDVRGAGC